MESTFVGAGSVFDFLAHLTQFLLHVGYDLAKVFDAGASTVHFEFT